MKVNWNDMMKSSESRVSSGTTSYCWFTIFHLLLYYPKI